MTGSRFEANTAFLGTELSGGAIYVSNAFEAAAVANIDGCIFAQVPSHSRALADAWS